MMNASANTSTSPTSDPSGGRVYGRMSVLPEELLTDIFKRSMPLADIRALPDLDEGIDLTEIIGVGIDRSYALDRYLDLRCRKNAEIMSDKGEARVQAYKYLKSLRRMPTDRLWWKYLVTEGGSECREYNLRAARMRAYEHKKKKNRL